jgi:sirohydrochlorin cobaltochelatase
MRATVLFAHGSRDPVWRFPLDQVVARMIELYPKNRVRCAFLELTEPNLQTVTAELAAINIHHITIVPMFFGIGRHVREDLPKLVSQLKNSYPHIDFLLRTSVGEDPRVIELLANLSLPDDLPSTAPPIFHPI